MATQETTRPPSIATSLWFVSLPSLEGIEAVTKQADGIELRLDLFPSITLSSLTQYVHCPLLLTLRSKAHGGAFQGSSMEYQQLLFALAELSPFFIDLEYDRDPLFLREIISKYPHIRWVLSYHMTKNKYDLPTLYQQMSRFPAYTYKIAITPKTTTEALQALLFTLHHSNISLICMGDKGSFARILAPLYGNKINFVKHIHSTAEGQLSLQDLSLYRHASFSAKTALYGLIGDPVSHSQGHIHHNTLFAKRNFDALYLKMQVSQEELSSFLPLAWELGFQGLSVTMPLKETILPLEPKRWGP
ncbi:MAG: type I 3-dehydroquinate dehydratase [Chlamydiae bacterium]|nr:type I 3-dehydroquinate dehydratase [Chlamydiota bacterium]